MNGFCRIMQKIMGVIEYIPPHTTGFQFWQQVHQNEIFTLQFSCINMMMYMYMLECSEKCKQSLLLQNDNASIDAKMSEYAHIKFCGLYDMIQRIANTGFYTEVHMQNMMDLFSRTQRAYRGFSLLSRRWKMRTTYISVQADLCLNPIDPAKTSSIMILQEGARYRFTLFDLLNIIQGALMHSPNFFADPLMPKNPYTNIPFSKAALFEIYWAVRHSNFTMPVLFHQFWLAYFNTNTFMYENEALIRDVYLENYVKKSPVSELYTHVRKMLRTIDKNHVLQIDPAFPKDILVNIMRPYLKLYMTNMYSISKTDKKYRSFFILQRKFREFIRYNPEFGRRRQSGPVETRTGQPFVVVPSEPSRPSLPLPVGPRQTARPTQPVGPGQPFGFRSIAGENIPYQRTIPLHPTFHIDHVNFYRRTMLVRQSAGQEEHQGQMSTGENTEDEEDEDDDDDDDNDEDGDEDGDIIIM